MSIRDTNPRSRHLLIRLDFEKHFPKIRKERKNTQKARKPANIAIQPTFGASHKNYLTALSPGNLDGGRYWTRTSDPVRVKHVL